MSHVSIFMKIYKPQYAMLEVSNYSIILLHYWNNEFLKNKIINIIV